MSFLFDHRRIQQKGISTMKLYKIIIISAAISSSIHAGTNYDSIFQKLSGSDYALRQEARDELFSAAAEVSSLQANPVSLEDFCSAVLQAIQENDLDTQGKVFLTRILTRIGTQKSVPVLVRIAQDTKVDPIVREHAVMAVSAIPGREISKQLIAGLKSAAASDKATWWQAIQHQVDASMVAGLISEIGKTELQESPEAWTALGKIGGSEAAEFMVGLLGKTNADNKSILERAILDSNSCDSSQLKRLLDGSADHTVKTGAYRQLVERHPQSALEELDILLADPSPQFRQNVIRISLEAPGQQFWDRVVARLPQLTTAELNTFLIAVGEQNRLQYEDQVIKNLNGDTQVAALHALAKIGTSKSTPVLLEKIVDDDETVQDLAIYALSQVQDPELDRQIVARVKM